MPNWAIAWAVGLLIGLIIGRFAARDSNREKPVIGGPVARVAHYLACSLIMAGAPTALLVTLTYGEAKFFPRLLTAVGIVFTNLAVAAVCLLVAAAFEKSVAQPTA